MVQVVFFAIFALLLARVMRAPRGTWRWILAAAAAVLAGSQLLPEGNAFREDVRGSLAALGWLALGLVPVALYALVIRHLRARTGVDAGRGPARPSGLVLIPEDAGLARDTARALAGEGLGSGETLSVGWRDGAGALTGHARLRLGPGEADLEMLWVAPDARGAGIGSRLLGQAEAEARERGAGRLVATAGGAGSRFLEARGFTAYGTLAAGAGPERRHLVKALT